MMTDFAQNLRRYREQAGYSAKEFSKLLGLSFATYAGYEYKGREPKFTLLRKIADTLNVSLDDLVGRTLKNIAFRKMIIKRFTKID